MELDFSRDILEKLLFKQILTDKQYMNVVSQNFDKRWFKVANMSTLIDLSVKFFRKYGKIPNSKTLKALTKGFLERTGRTETNLNEISDLIDSALNMELNLDKDVLTSYLNTFIRKQALYTSIMDNVDDIESN